MIFGIDPGLTGAFCCLDDLDGSFRGVEDLPVIRDKSLAWIDGAGLTDLIHRYYDAGATAIIERVGSRPGQSSVATFTFGVGYGSILGVLRSHGIPIEFVTPATWKRFYGLPKEKDAALQKARLLFPMADLRLKKHHGRAESLLIAKWYYERQGKKEKA